ncbi:hypothetical protein H8356DRAFT_1654229 [Neocallimastix lanati (nom. inval.)]|jgi:poly(ADP-ribose) glycohydrolase|nr:hypothetical protein H8356DRAFT_1654229 [Neocallimastix sp. JGI-2020a]
MSLEKINKLIKKIHTKSNLEYIYDDDPSLVNYDFGNIMICNNEINVSEGLKAHLHYVYLPYNKHENPPKFDSSRYNFIKKTLTSSPITDAKKFMIALSKYNCIEINEEYDYKNIQQYTDQFPEEAEIFFKEILPFIIEQALKLPEYITTSIPVMRKYMNIALTFNKLQVLSLLANQFLCTFYEKTHEKYDTPQCSFFILLSSTTVNDSSVEKLRCIIHYFDKMRKRDLESLKSELITFQRISMDRNALPDWSNVKLDLCEFNIDDRKIEDCENMLQLSCGNSHIGGSVLINRCFIEEIRFAICPELFISMIFTQKLYYLESSIIKGIERFSNYIGCDDGFKYNGDYDDQTPIDESKKRATEVAAIDPHYYSASTYYDQYSKNEVLRELNKLYSGFKENNISSLKKGSYVATTHWGTINYNGDIELTSILQILAASVAGRKINYCKCICGGYKQLHNMNEFLDSLKKHNITTDKLYKFIRSYRHEVIINVSKSEPPECTLMEYILNRINHHYNHHNHHSHYHHNDNINNKNNNEINNSNNNQTNNDDNNTNKTEKKSTSDDNGIDNNIKGSENELGNYSNEDDNYYSDEDSKDSTCSSNEKDMYDTSYSNKEEEENGYNTNDGYNAEENDNKNKLVMGNEDDENEKNKSDINNYNNRNNISRNNEDGEKNTGDNEK